MNKPNYLPDVKTQYEHLPYPPVDPEDEHKRLQRTWLEDLPMINHYCFRGQESFRNGFRVLVAGGGTGDATIFLAEQLKETDAEIVHLDLSEASIAIAMKRAAIRRLGNIRWVQGSLLDLPTLGLGEFDYINCVGVLHHLADPDAGLRALRGVLKARGALALMLYGAVGRTGVYHMQNLLRLANRGCSEADKIAQAKEVLAGLPQGNWYRLAGDLYGDHNNGDAGIYDSLLHSQDRAYTVPELMEWLVDSHGMHITFSDVHRGRFPYLPEMTLPPAARQLRARLPGMALRDRHAMSELLIGDLTRHNLYASATDATAPYGDTAYIPFYFHEPMDGRALEGIFGPKNGQLTIMRHEFLGLTVAVDAGKYSGKILRHVDGMRTFGEIFALVRSDPGCAAAGASDAMLFDDFRQTYDALNAIERLLLRHASCR